MSLLRKAVSFATSPQGRRAIDKARNKLDTPENRRKLSGLLGRDGNGDGAGSAGSGGGAPRQATPRR